MKFNILESEFYFTQQNKLRVKKKKKVKKVKEPKKKGYGNCTITYLRA